MPWNRVRLNLPSVRIVSLCTLLVAVERSLLIVLCMWWGKRCLLSWLNGWWWVSVRPVVVPGLNDTTVFFWFACVKRVEKWCWPLFVVVLVELSGGGAWSSFVCVGFGC